MSSLKSLEGKKLQKYMLKKAPQRYYTGTKPVVGMYNVGAAAKAKVQAMNKKGELLRGAGVHAASGNVSAEALPAVLLPAPPTPPPFAPPPSTLRLQGTTSRARSTCESHTTARTARPTTRRSARWRRPAATCRSRSPCTP